MKSTPIMMHPRYPRVLAVLVAFLADYTIHAWNTESSRVISESRVSLKEHSMITNAALLRIPRGGGEQSNVDDDHIGTDTASAEEPQSLDNPKETEYPPQNGEKAQSEIRSPQATTPLSALPQERKVRHTSDVIVRLTEKNSALNEESLELRELISNRAHSYIEELSQAENKLPHPRRVLHYVAPKIPAIKHSPDVMLRVHSSKGGIDTGVAACTIGTVARLCELYDRRKLQSNEGEEEETVSVGADIVRDRRFQQLVECVLCGVDVKKRKQEAENMKGKETLAADTNEARDIEEVLDEEDAEIDEGLSVQDACRAAWGIAVLTGFHAQSFSGVATEDILTALALRSRELLLARLQLLREGDTLKEDNESTLTLVERLDRDAEELAEDAASAMWTFACVKACTGVRSVALFETCCTILCQDPIDLRERALETKEGLDGSNFEVNEVIEKLERSEIGHFSNDTAARVNTNMTAVPAPIVNATDDPETSDTSKDALLDWLSPNEVTDVLWALALHGSTVDTDSKEEIALSETAAAFREIAFDRLLTWLRRDLYVIDEVKQTDTNSSALRPEDIETEYIELDGSDISVDGSGEMVVEVVDAATLLEASTTMKTEVVKADIDVKDDREGVDVKQVQVVDAATLLACTPEEIPLEMETEVIVTSTTGPPHEASTEPADCFDQSAASAISQESLFQSGTARKRNSVFSDMAALLRSGQLSFSPHDLCSIAWAVTDLRDPLRFFIVDLITQMFSRFGGGSVESLSMADLSNLAWAIARSAPQKQALSWPEYSATPAAVVTRWTAESALARLRIDGHILEDRDVALAVRSMLQEFQPPELGRLMWSLACTVSNYIDPFEYRKERNAAVSQLSMLALLTAGSNLSIFSTEDLVGLKMNTQRTCPVCVLQLTFSHFYWQTRIAWAFLELCDTKEALSQPLVAESFGSILAVVETSLLAWESGPFTKPALLETKRAEDSLHFSTFFGKSRFPLPLLNQRIHEHEDEDGGPKVKKAALPLLRDLPVDPASLCKLSSAFSRLIQEQRNIVGGWTFVRVAVRLLSSKNGQLMERCPLIDVIGLCHACAISDVNGKERGQVVRLFAGRVVQFMNDALDPDRDTHGKVAERLGRASPWEISTLLWSLGELGARHFTTDANQQMAHRKLRLVADGPFLTDNDLQSLSAASTVNLVGDMIQP